MPFFGLVWVASWVGCFFSSHQDLLNQPRYLAETLPLPLVSEAFDRSKLRTSLERIQSTISVASARTASSLPRAAAPPVRAENSSRPVWLRVASLLFPATLGDRSGRVVPVSYTPSIASAPDDLAQATLDNPVGMMQSFVWGWRLVAGVPRTHKQMRVSVNSVPFQKVGEDCRDRSQEGSCVLQPVSTAAPQSSIFQVRVQNQVVAEVRSRQQADQVVQQLQQLLNDPLLDPTQLQPSFDRGVPVVRFRDQVLFTVDRGIARAWGYNPEILAVRWVNALRSTLDEAPFALADAQARMYNLRETESELQGLASWYGPYFHGRQTATGEIFDQDELTAAHPSLPFDTYLRVTNQKNGKSVVVRVNDRGPYVDNRILDLSREAARSIDSEQTGVVPITARIMQPDGSTTPLPQSLAQL